LNGMQSHVRSGEVWQSLARGVPAGRSPRARSTSPPRQRLPRASDYRPSAVSMTTVPVEHLLPLPCGATKGRDRPPGTEFRITRYPPSVALLHSPRQPCRVTTPPPRRRTRLLERYAATSAQYGRHGKLDPVPHKFGRDDETSPGDPGVCRWLTHNNPLLTGDPVAARTAIVRGWASAHLLPLRSP